MEKYLMKTNQNDVETNTYNKKESSNNGIFGTFFDGVLLRILVSLMVFLVPFILTVFTYISSLETRIKVLEINYNNQSEIIRDIRVDLKEIKSDINLIKIRLR
jgi:hypothetical protein